MNKAHELIYDFINWGFKTAEPKRAGQARAVRRIDAIRAWKKSLYSNTPELPKSRQVKRAEARAKFKRERTHAKIERRRQKRRAKGEKV